MTKKKQLTKIAQNKNLSSNFIIKIATKTLSKIIWLILPK